VHWRAVLCAGAVVLAPQLIPAQSPLDQRVSLSVRDAPLAEALLRLKREQQVPLAWRGDLIPPLTRVSVQADEQPLREVLDHLLRNTLLAPHVTLGGTVVLVVRDALSSADEAATGVHLLDHLVVTGSAVSPAAHREQPTSVSVVTRADLDAAPHVRLSDAMRAFLPGVVLWDHGGAGPPPVIAGIRGVASFTSRAPKVYIDGIEVASPELFTLLDLRGIERIEVIPGPQGAALYGPEAIAGVIQLETRKGTVGERYVTPGLEARGGGLDRGSDGTSLWREGAASIDGSSGPAAAHLVASWSRIGSGVPLAEARRAQVAGQWQSTQLHLTWSARLAQHDGVQERLTASGALGRVRASDPLDERGVSVRLVHTASSRWSHLVTVGAHRIAGPREPSRSAILPPTLPLAASHEIATRYSARWAGTVEHEAFAMTLGAEVSRRELVRRTRPADIMADLSPLYDEALESRGGFAQLRVRHGGLVLSAGARGDRVSSVGTEAGAPWAATAGAAWTTPLGLSTLRLRAAWGRALRPPEPGMSAALTTGSIAQEGSPQLTAERQDGYEVGAEWHAANGAWLRLTWFDQRAEGLIQQVDLRRTVEARRLYQFQNVGAITNRGVEVDAGAHWGSVSVAGRVNLVRSRVAELSPTYTGEFESGDPPLEVPTSMTSVAIRYDRGAARVEVGASWLGPWTGYDWRLIQRVEAGESPLRDRVREYWLDYPGVLRPFVGATVELGRGLVATARAEWPTSAHAMLRDNLTPSPGRSLVAGLRFNQ
jgi:outer membrane receptor protein involved in Fe transport